MSSTILNQVSTLVLSDKEITLEQQVEMNPEKEEDYLMIDHNGYELIINVNHWKKLTALVDKCLKSK